MQLTVTVCADKTGTEYKEERQAYVKIVAEIRDTRNVY
jgi:hypothetical protein